MRGPTRYHKSLRSTAVVMAFVLLFDSGMVSTTTRLLSQHAQESLANVVGIFASVPPNELNVITAELQKQRAELDAREREINARALETNTNENNTSTLILSGVLFLLLVLIVLNYALDIARLHRMNTTLVKQ